MTGTKTLRSILEEAAQDGGVPMKDLTVLSPQRDPFRLDTPTHHRNGQWLAENIRDLVGDRTFHLRGGHYMLLGRPKPDGTDYANTDDDWVWLQNKAAKAARWLGYVPFEQIVDERNADPVVRVVERKRPFPYLSVGVDVSIPDVDDLVPEPWLGDFFGIQEYRLVIFGEKSSLTDVLGPIADQYQADLYVSAGEMSDTHIYNMAKLGGGDGRPMVVLVFADSDPSGHQMAVSIARKLQALRLLRFPDLDFEVHQVALTPDQVREYGLPSTPLKATEQRADRWREATGVEQTEIDALASLRPDLLRQLARQAVEPFYDSTLNSRVNAARSAWQTEARAAVAEQMDSATLDLIRREAAGRLGELSDQIDEINQALRLSTDDIGLPAVPAVPEAFPSGDRPAPLVDSRWAFAEQCRKLIISKSYGNAATS